MPEPPPGPWATESRPDEGEAEALAPSETFRPAVDPSDLERRLVLTLTDEARWQDTLPAWHGMVREIGTLDFGARREIEGSVIDALSGLLKRVAERPPAGPGDRAMRELAAVAVAFDEEFGWAEDDRLD